MHELNIIYGQAAIDNLKMTKTLRKSVLEDPDEDGRGGEGAAGGGSGGGEGGGVGREALEFV
jgi:hypothetical protein